MKSYFVGLLVVALALAVGAQLPNIGTCPEYLPMPNFSFDKFSGLWHEAERNFQINEIGSRCITSNYTLGTDGKYHVINEVRSQITGIKRVLEGEIRKASSKSEEGKFQIKYASVPFFSYESQYIVLETDYKSFAVLWNCATFWPISVQNSWVMTRMRFPPGEVLQKAYGVLDKYKISKFTFTKTNQNDCDYDEAPIEPTKATQTTNNYVDEEDEVNPAKSAELAAEPLTRNADLSAKQPEIPLSQPAAAEPIKAPEELAAPKSVSPKFTMKIAAQAKEELKDEKSSAAKEATKEGQLAAEPVREATPDIVIRKEEKKTYDEANALKKDEQSVAEATYERAQLEDEKKKKKIFEAEPSKKNYEIVEEKIEIVKP